MNEAELDRILSETECIAPSDDFVSSVMNAVEREGTPSPLAFPLVRALPGFIGLAASLIATLVFAVRALVTMNASPGTTYVPTMFAVTQSYAVGWVVIAFAVTLASLFAPLRWVRSSGQIQ